MKLTLGPKGRSQGIGSPHEGHAEGIADGLEHMPLVGLDRLPQDGVVASQSRPHPLRLRLPQPRAALDVREEEGDGAGRRLNHGSPSPRSSVS